MIRGKTMKTDFELEVLRKYGTYGACEKHMKWAQGTVTKIAQGNRKLKGNEIDHLIDEFSVNSVADIKRIFFKLDLPTGKKSPT